MGLDIYSGTLTRYYAGNWKTVTQQWAEENGYTFNLITPGRDSPPAGEQMSPVEIQEAMENWRDHILAAFTQPDQQSFPPWPEDNEKPYFTDKPDWDALGAMLLVAACHSYGEEVPPMVAKGWNFMEHPLIRRLSEDQDSTWSLFRGVTWWIPHSDSFMFQASAPTGDHKMIATTAALRRELETLNSLAWQADRETILSWSQAGYPAEGVIQDQNSVLNEADITAQTGYDTGALARFSFSLFCQALIFAEENQVPILLDY